LNTLRAYKFLVMPVLQLVDEEGGIVGEQSPQQPDVLFGVDGLARYAAGFDAALERHLAAIQNGAGNPAAVAIEPEGA